MKQPILILDQQSWRGGAQAVLDEVLRALDPDYAPLVALPDDGPYAAELRGHGVETVVYPLGHYRAGRKSVFEMIEFAARSLYCGLRLARTIAQRGIRLVYINGPRCLPAGVLAARLTRRPSLFHLHLAMTRRADIFLASRLARHVTRLVACSEAAAESLNGIRPELSGRTRVLYNPVRRANADSPATRAGPHPFPGAARRVVGMVARVTRQKGHHILLRAVSRLSSRLGDVHVVLVGGPAPGHPEDTQYLNELQGSARELGLAEKVSWVGHQLELAPYYARFDVLVIPSVESEGLPMVALEAMHWGVPVIASRVGGLPEVVRRGYNGFLVPPGDDAALAETLGRVLGDPVLRARLRIGARATAHQRFSPENFRASIRSIVGELCPPASPAAKPTAGREAPA